MKIAMYDSRSYDRAAFEESNQQFNLEITFLEPRLTKDTAKLAHGFSAVCSFVNDSVDESALKVLHAGGCRLLALRCAGFNHVDMEAAKELGIKVVRVPEYSPYAVAEHAFALLLALNRKIHRAHARVRELNFTLDGLVGFDLHGKTFGVVGLGRIGIAAARIAKGFGCRVLGYDIQPDHALLEEIGVELVDLDTLYTQSHMISLHVPLNPETYHLVDAKRFAQMRQGCVLVNTSRGGLVDASAMIKALKTARLGGAVLDVYEEEEGVFFQNLSEGVLQDDVLARLLTFPNVLITSHQAFLTKEALINIAETTLQSVSDFYTSKPLQNEI